MNPYYVVLALAFLFVAIAAIELLIVLRNKPLATLGRGRPETKNTTQPCGCPLNKKCEEHEC